jgi:hypothetical protein
MGYSLSDPPVVDNTSGENLMAVSTFFLPFRELSQNLEKMRGYGKLYLFVYLRTRPMCFRIFQTNSNNQDNDMHNL